MMSFEIVKEEETTDLPTIRIIGVGGCGGNAVNNMIERGIAGVNYITCNTDLMALNKTLSSTKIQIGKNITKGYGAGTDPEIGKKAAEEDIETIKEALRGTDFLFITAGMGKGTGTGASPVIAQVAQKMGILTVGIITMPFKFENIDPIAEMGIENLKNHLHAYIIVRNENIKKVAPKNLINFFDLVNNVLYNATKGIAEMITKHGMQNIDLNDIKKAFLGEDGKGVGEIIIGYASVKGDDRGIEVVKQSMESPFIERSMKGAKWILFKAVGNLPFGEFEKMIEFIQSELGKDVKIRTGYDLHDRQEDVSLTLVATTFADPSSISEKSLLPEKRTTPQPTEVQIPKSTLEESSTKKSKREPTTTDSHEKKEIDTLSLFNNNDEFDIISKPHKNRIRRDGDTDLPSYIRINK